MKFAISAMYFSIDNSAKNIATAACRRLVRAKFSWPSVAGEESKRLSGPTALPRKRSQNPVIQKIYLKKTNRRQKCNWHWKPWQQVGAY